MPPIPTAFECVAHSWDISHVFFAIPKLRSRICLEDLLSFCNMLSVTTNLLQRGTFLSFMFHKNGQNSLPVAIALAQAAQSLSFALKRFGEERTGHTRNHPGWHMPQTAVFALSGLNRSCHAVGRTLSESVVTVSERVAVLLKWFACKAILDPGNLILSGIDHGRIMI